MRIFLGHVADAAQRDPTTGFPVVKLTEHAGHEWMKWNPPHHIQQNTIDPLLKAAKAHFKAQKERAHEREARREDGDEEEGSEDGSEQHSGDEASAFAAEVASGTVSLADEERVKDMNEQQTTRRRANYNSRKTRRQRNAMVAGGGYALLDKVRDETGRGQVGIYSEDNIVFPESALNTQAKLILKRNDKANKYAHGSS